MKNILTVVLLTVFSFAKAQTVSDYKYITVPRKFADFEKNSYKLDAHLKMYLRKKNYEIIVEGVTDKPADLKSNPCLAAKADIQSIKSTFKNKLKVVFTDCNDRVLNEYEGVSSIKEFDKGYQEALSFAMNTVPLQNAKEVPNTLVVEDKKEIALTTQSPKTEEKNTNLYQANGKSYQVASTTNGNFFLIDSENAQTVAQFYPSSQKNIYHVTVISANGNYQTLGFVIGNEIIIEHQTADKSWKTTTYTK